MKRTSFEETNKEPQSSYLQSSCSNRRLSDAQLASCSSETLEKKKVDNKSMIRDSFHIKSDSMHAPNKSIPPVATISPRIKMRYIFDLEVFI